MAIADRVGRIQDRHKVPGEEFRALKSGLVEVVYEWAKGMVRELLPMSATNASNKCFAAVRADLRVDRRTGRNGCSRHHAPG